MPTKKESKPLTKEPKKKPVAKKTGETKPSKKPSLPKKDAKEGKTVDKQEKKPKTKTPKIKKTPPPVEGPVIPTNEPKESKTPKTEKQNIDNVPPKPKGPADKKTNIKKQPVDVKKPPKDVDKKKEQVPKPPATPEPTPEDNQSSPPQKEPTPPPAPPAKGKEEEESNAAPESKGIIEINELITVRDLSIKMSISVGELLKKLLSLGSLSTINQRLDVDTATLLLNEFNYEAKLVSIYSDDDISEKKEDITKLKPRPPVVTIIGHVDHGKNSLLDAIRKTNVVGGEYGGITQHIGAYRVKIADGRFITFLDTPGHEAFTAMRSRGAQVTDIVVLVVSAADGIMPQTIEAINHAKDAKVPIIVAVNKIDLPTADPQKVKQELSKYDLLAEEWGGDTIMVEISAKRGINIELLLENIQLKADMMELKANPDRMAEGIVIEARLDSKKGTLATLLVENGVLKIGENVVIGTTYGKVRAMYDEYGKRFHEAFPSMPTEVLGINTPPRAGDKFVVVSTEQQARQIAETRFQKAKIASLTGKRHLSLADISAGKTKDLRIVLKTDVQGSLEAVSDELERMSTNEINLKIVHRGAGSITASDVDLAVASDALIFGFNLRPDSTVERLAEEAGINIHVYRIIYELTAEVKAAMEGLLDPDIKEKILGKALVKQVFKLSSAGAISGCSITEGKIQRSSKARLLRDNVIVFEGTISSLKRFKEDVKEVDKGFECGIGLENFADIKSGDIIECFALEKVARKL
ncbi:MAG: translation initiation factor IF-2 [Elusimicrobiota bacterium]|jgi:translation initiation factor IF-2|nr:translation initiation factor IF-2 [Elusimicrobiota bacterium]